MGQLAKRTAKRDAEYRRRRTEYLDAHPLCEVRWENVCSNEATEIEHRCRRSQLSYDKMLDTRLWFSVCHPCGQYTTTNPGAAKAAGVQLERWQINATHPDLFDGPASTPRPIPDPGESCN